MSSSCMAGERKAKLSLLQSEAVWRPAEGFHPSSKQQDLDTSPRYPAASICATAQHLVPSWLVTWPSSCLPARLDGYRSTETACQQDCLRAPAQCHPVPVCEARSPAIRVSCPAFCPSRLTTQPQSRVKHRPDRTARHQTANTAALPNFGEKVAHVDITLLREECLDETCRPFRPSDGQPGSRSGGGGGSRFVLALTSSRLFPFETRRGALRHLGLEGDRGTQLVGVGRSLRVAELGGVERKTERGLDAGAERLGVAEAEDTRVVDLGLHEGGRCRVVRGTGTGLGVGVDTVVVAGRVGRQVAEAVEGDGVVGGVEAGAEVVAAQLALLDVVAGLSTGEEAVAAEDGVGGEGGALEEVKVLAGVQTGLLVGRGEERVLGLLLGHERRDELELEALGDVVLELNVVAEHVGGGPGLGEGDAVLAVLPLGLEVAVDGLRLGVTDAENAEGDTVGRLGLDLERVAVDGVVLGQEVVGSLACGVTMLLTKVLPGRGNGLGDDGSHFAGGCNDHEGRDGMTVSSTVLAMYRRASPGTLFHRGYVIEPAVQTDKGWLSEVRLGGGGKLGMQCQQRIPCSCSRNTYSNEGESTRRRDTKGVWDGGAEETGDGSLVEDDARMSLSLSLSPSLVLCCTLDPNRATSGRLLLGLFGRERIRLAGSV
ncbi:hypothetical protein L1887_55225 [Cichorium endivia]|nr:hypothetical protein L1887_55225 [Cichorium endivia]